MKVMKESRASYTKIKDNIKQGNHDEISRTRKGRARKKNRVTCHCATRTIVESVNIPNITLHNRKINKIATGSCPLANKLRRDAIKKVQEDRNKGQGNMIDKMKVTKHQERLIALARIKHYIGNVAFTIKNSGNQEDMLSLIFEIENVVGILETGRRQIRRWIDAVNYDNFLTARKVKAAEMSDAILGGEWFQKKANKVKISNIKHKTVLYFRKMVSIENKLNIISMFVGDFHEYLKDALVDVKEGRIEDLELFDEQMEQVRNIATAEIKLIREIVDKINENNPDPDNLNRLYEEIQGILKVGKNILPKFKGVLNTGWKLLNKKKLYENRINQDKGKDEGIIEIWNSNHSTKYQPTPTKNNMDKNPRFDKTSLLTAGDIESNPGPEIPETPIIDEQNFYIIFDIPDIELYEHNEFQFEEMAITVVGKEPIKQRCHNNIYSCPSCISINKCFKKSMFFYIREKITLSCNYNRMLKKIQMHILT